MKKMHNQENSSWGFILQEGHHTEKIEKLLPKKKREEVSFIGRA